MSVLLRQCVATSVCIFKYVYVLCNNYAQRTREFVRNWEIEKETRGDTERETDKGFWNYWPSRCCYVAYNCISAHLIDSV